MLSEPLLSNKAMSSSKGKYDICRELRRKRSFLPLSRVGE